MPTTDATVIGHRYRLLNQLGAGGMGTVWRAHDILLDREVAVKEVVVPHHLSDVERQTLQARTMREARTAARLDDPAVVSVYDVVNDGVRPWIVMELLHGRTLAQTIRAQGYLSPPYVAAVGLSVLRGLRAAHGAGILHRDVKPSNVILADDGRIVLTDFGVAIVEGDPSLTTSGMLIGSPSFLPPEVARGERSGPPSDLWSLGATLYAAIQGVPPFERGGALATITAAITEPHAPPDRATPALRAAIDGLLVKDPARRMGAPAVAQLLRAAAAGATTSAAGASAAGVGPAPGTAPTTAPLQAGPKLAAAAPALTGRSLPSDHPSAPFTPPPAYRSERLPSVGRLPTRGPDDPPAAGRRRSRLLDVTLAAAALVLAVVVGLMALADRGSDPTAQPRTGEVPVPGSTQGEPAPGGGVPAAPSQGVSGTPAQSPEASEPVASATDSSEPSDSAPTAPESDPPAEEPAAGTAPAGFRLHDDPTGFSVAVPDGWTVERESTYVDFEDPASGRYLRVDQTNQPKGDPYADWVAQEEIVSQRLTNYDLIRIDALDYRGWEAADWEFTYGTSGTHVLNRNVLTGPMAYALYWSVPATQWEQSQQLFEVFAATFVPAA